MFGTLHCNHLYAGTNSSLIFDPKKPRDHKRLSCLELEPAKSLCKQTESIDELKKTWARRKNDPKPKLLDQSITCHSTRNSNRFTSDHNTISRPFQYCPEWLAHKNALLHGCICKTFEEKTTYRETWRRVRDNQKGTDVLLKSIFIYGHKNGNKMILSAWFCTHRSLHLAMASRRLSQTSVIYDSNEQHSYPEGKLAAFWSTLKGNDNEIMFTFAYFLNEIDMEAHFDGFWRVLMGSDKFWWVLAGSDGIRPVLMGFGGVWWVLVIGNESNWTVDFSLV